MSYICSETCVSSSHTGQAAPSFTDLNATNVQYDRATIQWTVPVIAYTPETYVVNYGTDMSALNSMSETTSSGSDFEQNELILSVQLLGLLSGTVYYYQLVANNTFNATESSVEAIQTQEDRKNICFCRT